MVSWIRVRMWYSGVMAQRNPRLNWDRLLDGGTYVLDLDRIGWARGLSDLRAKVHYEVDRRRGIAHTHKIDATTLEISAEYARVTLPPVPCTCKAKPWELHVITCAIVKAMPTRKLAPDHPDFVPAPQEQPPTTAVHADELDDEALLGPCTCGQSPQCLPTCARAGGQAA